MKIIDCLQYFDEDMLLDVRLNTLNEHVSQFIVCEATFTHRGEKKKLNFDIKNFKKFKDKITYIVLEKEPENLKNINDNDDIDVKHSKILDNAHYRENSQRNYHLNYLEKFSDEDLILINDLDEIPNLNEFKYKNKITIFKQKLFCYKFNLLSPGVGWVGSKICKKKYLPSPQWLRNIKSKKYPFWRIDALFSKTKYFDVQFIENGGWHFTNIKSAEQIDHKMRNFEHYLEYEYSGIKVDDIKKKIAEKKILYDYFSDTKDVYKGYKEKKFEKLEKLDLKYLPDYISKNKDQFSEWLD